MQNVIKYPIKFVKKPCWPKYPLAYSCNRQNCLNFIQTVGTWEPKKVKPNKFTAEYFDLNNLNSLQNFMWLAFQGKHPLRINKTGAISLINQYFRIHSKFMSHFIKIKN